MVAIPFPVTTIPGERPQEGAGRLINVFVEPRGAGLGPVWRRVPGAVVFARDPSVGQAIAQAIARSASDVVLVAGMANGNSNVLGSGSQIVLVVFSSDGDAICTAVANAEFASVNNAFGAAETSAAASAGGQAIQSAFQATVAGSADAIASGVEIQAAFAGNVAGDSVATANGIGDLVGGFANGDSTAEGVGDG